MARSREYAAMEMHEGLYRLICVSWEQNAHGDNYDYFHAAFERDGRWAAEFYDDKGQVIRVKGTEETRKFTWEHDTPFIAERGWPERGDPSICVRLRDVEFEKLPSGSLCQNIEERQTQIPRYWKKWRIA